MKILGIPGVILSFFIFLFTSTVLAEAQSMAPTIIEQPTNNSVVVGGEVTFSVTATGTSPLNYYWSFNGSNIPGATNSTLTLTDVMPSQAGNYSVFIINAYGSTNSSTAKLTVYGIPPFITTEPTNTTAFAGSNATFSVAAAGTPPLNYQWNFNGTNILGATNTALTLTNLQTSQTGNYTVTVENAYGSTNATATLTVTPTGTDQFFDDFSGPSLNPIWQANLPDATSGSLGTGVQGDAAYIGAPNYSFGLLDSNTVLNLHSAIGPFQRVGWSWSTNFPPDFFRYEARFNTLYLSSTTSIDGFLEIWIMNATNDNLFLMVSTFDGESDTVPYVFFGTSLINIYGAVPYPFANNTWYRLALQSLPGQYFHASLCDDNERELFGTDLAAYDTSAFGSGFKIAISQDVGADGTNATTAVALDYVSLTSQFSPAIIDQPQSQAVPEGSNASLNIVAEGPPPLSYQWTLEGTSITDATNATLTITDFQSANSGAYNVTVTNAYGVVISSNAFLSLPNRAPMILEQPGNELVPAGATATISVTATGTLPLNYYWSFKNANIPGATNSTLTLTNVAPSQAGNYSVFIINAYGSTNSATATLTVIKSLPRLAIFSSSGALHISWPTNSTGFVLVTTTNLLSPNWVPVTTSPVVSSNQFVVPIVPSGASAFYRLQFTGN